MSVAAVLACSACAWGPKEVDSIPSEFRGSFTLIYPEGQEPREGEVVGASVGDAVVISSRSGNTTRETTCTPALMYRYHAEGFDDIVIRCEELDGDRLPEAGDPTPIDWVRVLVIRVAAHGPPRFGFCEYWSDGEPHGYSYLVMGYLDMVRDG